MNDTLRALSWYRMEQAKRCIRSAKVLADDEDYKGAANRSYYAIFHCMRAVLALEGKDFSKHSGVSAYFRKEYIKTGIFAVELSDMIKEAFDIRSDSDYDDYYLISRQEVLEQIENAEFFYQQVEKYLKMQRNNSVYKE